MRTHSASLQYLGWTHGPGVPASHGALDPVRADALRDLLRARGIPSLVLATCHRFEVYWSGDGSEASTVRAAIAEAVGEVHAVVPDRLSGDAAVAHAMAVASGLRSLRRGEPEILGQLRTAWRLSQSSIGSSHELDEAMRHTVSAARHIRRHLGDGAQESIGTATVRMLAEQWEQTAAAGARVLIIGAGAVGESVAAALQHARRAQLLPHVGTVHITNRTDSRAESLAQRTDARALAWDRWVEMLAQADVVVATARSAQPLITRAMAEVAMAQRALAQRGAATWIDLASPPNIAHDATVGSCVRRSLHDLPSQTVSGEDPAEVALHHEVQRYAADRERRLRFTRALAAPPARPSPSRPSPARMPATAA